MGWEFGYLGVSNECKTEREMNWRGETRDTSAVMSLICRLFGLSLRDGERSSDVRRQLVWRTGKVARASDEDVPLEVAPAASVLAKRLRVRSRTRRTLFMSHPACEHLRVPLEEPGSGIRG